jgi:serine/threonine protein kinase
MPAKSCPNPETLSNWALGKLSPGELDAVGAHVSDCATCQTRLAEAAGHKSEESERFLQETRGIDRAEIAQPERTAELPPKSELGFLEPPGQTGELGRLGPYRVLEILGEGGMGVVFKAEDTQLRRRVALKTMKPDSSQSPSGRERFLREARAMAAVSHTHIATIYQVGEERGVPFLAMELLPGQTLEKRMQRDAKGTRFAPLPILDVLRIARQTADGLAAAHAQNLIHRDIKPSNIWLREGDDCVKILDFGLARAESTEDVRLTQSGVVLGTPAFMAPEQAAGTGVDPRADLFSLGSVLYVMCTGKVPFQRGSTFDTLMAVTMDTPQPVRELNPKVPPGLDTLITRLLAKKPEDRPASAAAVRDALDELIRQQGGNDPTRSIDSRGLLKPPPCRASTLRRSLIFAALAAMIAVGIAIPLLHRPAVPGRLTIVAPADDARVLLDGNLVVLHDRRAEVPLESGKHQLLVSRPEFEDHTETLDVQPGATVERTVMLRRPPLPPVDEKWFGLVSRMKVLPIFSSPQAKKVGEKLAELNPGFDPNLRHDENYRCNFNKVLEPGKTAIVRLVISGDHLTNLSPVTALTQLKTLDCRGSAPGKGKIHDLSPLKGMKLERLDCRNNSIDDFTVLKDVPLHFIWCDDPERRLYELQQIPTLKRINGVSVPWKPADSTPEPEDK